ncbi:hypothetical protein JCM8547_006436 [Rhodosporidiobolus lusitaniae]
MASISGILPTSILCRRDGQEIEIAVENLVKGDVVVLKMGQMVPADIRLIECSPDMRFDRSILNGESIPVAAAVDKTDDNLLECRNIALQGTLLVEGKGIGICVGMGDLTVFGRIARAASGQSTVRTTLQIEFTRFVSIIASLAAAVVVFIVILWAAWLRRDHTDFINMKKQGVLAKQLSTVESLGCVNVIASNKTGTLTQNRMSVVSNAIGSQTIPAQEARRLALNLSATTSSAVHQLVSIAAICNDAAFSSEPGQSNLPPETRKVNGDATDTGLLRFAESVVSVEQLRSAVKAVSQLAFNSENKFATKLVKAAKSVSALPELFEVVEEDAEHALLVKGAPDVLIKRCNKLLQLDGSVVPLTPSLIDDLSSTQSRFASLGQRVLLFAKRSVPTPHFSSTSGTLEDQMLSLVTDLTVVGLIALVDPPKHDTAETVARCRTAGIRFFIVTGDFSATAAVFARQVGILTAPEAAVKGFDDLLSDSSPCDSSIKGDYDLEKLTPKSALVLSSPEMLRHCEAQWEKVVKFDEIIFARTTPQQKLQIVKRLQADGCTVAVTGDGVNDSPTLKQADVGVAVAGGSEVAMEAADLILLDDFSAIVHGIDSGRLCFENLKKMVLNLFPAGSFSELMPVLLNVLFGLPQALSSIQMILIYAVTEVLPAMSLCFEKPEADLLTRPPRDRKKEHLADWKLLLHAYAFIGVLKSLTAMVGAFYFGFHRAGIPFSALWLKYGAYDVMDQDLYNERLAVAQSIYFFNLVLIQFANLLSTRTRRLSSFQQDPLFNPKTRNLRLFAAMACAIGLGIFFSYIPWFQKVFLRCRHGLHVEHFLLPLAYSVVLLSMDEARKWANRRWPTSPLAKVAW